MNMSKKILISLTLVLTALLGFSQSISIDSIVPSGKTLTIKYSGGTGDPKDWIGVYDKDTIPDGNPPSYVWQYITAASGQITLSNALKNGTYRVHLFCCDGYKSLASAIFEVAGAPPAKIEISNYVKTTDTIATFNFSGGTGSPTDWVGIYKPTDVPGTNASLAFEYVPGKDGSVKVPISKLAPGNYVARFFCCDLYQELANIPFQVYEAIAPSLVPVGKLTEGKPMVFKFTGGTGSLTDWVGLYPKDTVPDGDPGSIDYVYVEGINGEVTFTSNTLKPGVRYDAHLFCCDDYGIIASYKNFTVESTVASADARIPVKKNLFKINPNPATSVVNLVFEKPIKGQFGFYQLTGKSVRNIKVNGEETIKVYDLPAGVYIGRFENKEGFQATKVIIQ
jgi:hypothetical protein